MKQILFNTEMVRAILEGRKIVTRRDPFQMSEEYNRIKGLYRDSKNRLCAIFQCTAPEDPTIEEVHARYQPGDILWVRETWQTKRGGGYLYKADTIGSFDLFMTPEGRVVNYIPWRPSIHMPREAARIFLRVTGVRVERLQKITYDEAIREGADRGRALNNFEWIWNHTIKPADLSAYGWDANPWVWVFDFERISKEEAQTS